MQIGADYAIPAAGALKRLKDGTIATTDFQVTSRRRKIFVDETDNELVASNEPEMRILDFGQPIECCRIEAAGGFGKARVEQRNAEGIRHHSAARLAAP